jgi:hypothetical protein
MDTFDSIQDERTNEIWLIRLSLEQPAELEITRATGQGFIFPFLSGIDVAPLAVRVRAVANTADLARGELVGELDGKFVDHALFLGSCHCRGRKQDLLPACRQGRGAKSQENSASDEADRARRLGAAPAAAGEGRSTKEQQRAARRFGNRGERQIISSIGQIGDAKTLGEDAGAH